eukprot:3845622-Alexandrium_andersonii.AAC.1
MSASLVGSEMCIRDRTLSSVRILAIGQGHKCNAAGATAQGTAGDCRNKFPVVPCASFLHGLSGGGG